MNPPPIVPAALRALLDRSRNLDYIGAHGSPFDKGNKTAPDDLEGSFISIRFT